MAEEQPVHPRLKGPLASTAEPEPGTTMGVARAEVKAAVMRKAVVAGLNMFDDWMI